jgi:hypothetical protein
MVKFKIISEILLNWQAGHQSRTPPIARLQYSLPRTKSRTRHHIVMKCKRTSYDRKLDHHTFQVMRRQAIKTVPEGGQWPMFRLGLG